MAKTQRKAKAAATKPPTERIELKEYVRRRQAVLKSLGGAAAVVFAGERSVHNHAKYLLGPAAEPGAAVLFDPSAENPARRIALLLKPRDVEREAWDGFRSPLDGQLKKTSGFDTIFRTPSLPALLTAAARRTKKLACLMPFSVYPAAVSEDLAVYREVAQRVPGVSIIDQTQLLVGLRAIKSAAELKQIERAIQITAAGFDAVLKAMHPGMNERIVQRLLEQTYLDQGADGVAYDTIVGSGAGGTVLHYIANNQPMEKGSLVVIDSGAQFAGYAADVTRTFPVNGTFNSEQRDLYELTLKAMAAAFKASKPGTRFYQVDAAAREVFEKAGVGDAFCHSIGHPLGLEVHDVNPETPLQPGMVITIEPGIYFAEKKLGIRIEDDLLITRSGHRNLTDFIPKKAKDIEKALRR